MSVSFKTGISDIGQYYKTFSSITVTENQCHKSYHRFYDIMRVHTFVTSTRIGAGGVEISHVFVNSIVFKQ